MAPTCAGPGLLFQCVTDFWLYMLEFRILFEDVSQAQPTHSAVISGKRMKNWFRRNCFVSDVSD